MRRALPPLIATLLIAAGPAMAQDGPLILLPPAQQAPSQQVPAQQPPAQQTVPQDLSAQPITVAPQTTLTLIEPDAAITVKVVPVPRLSPRRFGGATTNVAAQSSPLDGTVDPFAKTIEAVLGANPVASVAEIVQTLPSLTSAPDSAANTRLLPSPTALPVGNGDLAANADLAFGAFQRGYYLSAFSLAIPRAEQGDTAAQTLLGIIYEGGYGIARDLAEAATWYEFAAAGGDREAQSALGMMYLEGRGVAIDRGRAADYLEGAAAGGKTAAKYNLALLYLEGVARPRDLARAAQLLGEAAQAGSPDAQFALAQLYEQGRGVTENQIAATSWYAEASRLGHVTAQVEYAIRLFNGTGIRKDEASAAAWFRRAADLGDPIAQNRYARILATGRGAAKDTTQAAKYHLLAATAGKQDSFLDDVVATLSEDQRRAAVVAAQRWPAD
ncbi:MAG: hypothetical protein ACTSP2_06265 [Alphaproteobacteria bacterium]